MISFLNIKKSLQFFLIVLSALSLNAQNEFLSPVKYKIKLSGSFGELRKNHFHTGIDIKSSGNWNTNKAVCVMDGYISRIRVGPDGYGNALYINHPNGLTSVYAHLNNFNKKISNIVHDFQYQYQTFAIYPDSLHIPVRQGEILGQIGNTGRSFGTHLHFELRHTDTEHPINPFKFGIKPNDSRAPVLEKLKIVALDTAFNVLNSKLYNLYKMPSGNYIIKPNTISYGAWRIGIEVKGYDRMNGAPNKNGIYKLAMKVDNEIVYRFIMDSLDFDKQNNLNAHIDFKEYTAKKAKYNRLYFLPGNDLEIYTVNSGSTIIPLYKDKKRNIEIIAEDFDGNKTKLNFAIKRDIKIIDSEPKLFNHHLKYGQNHKIEENGYYLDIEKDDLFKDMYLFLSNSNDSLTDIFSNDIRIFTNYEVFKNTIDLYIKPLAIDSNFNKLCIIKIGDKKNMNLGGRFVDGFFHTKIREGGTYKLMPDTIKPTLKPVNFKRNLAKTSKISFVINDNFDIGGYAKDITYNGFIDDKWVLFEYDKKKNKITHKFDENLKKGKHILKLIVEDDRGNKNNFKREFIK